jgi:hypothetical protein
MVGWIIVVLLVLELMFLVLLMMQVLSVGEEARKAMRLMETICDELGVKNEQPDQLDHEPVMFDSRGNGNGHK